MFTKSSLLIYETAIETTKSPTPGPNGCQTVSSRSPPKARIAYHQ